MNEEQFKKRVVGEDEHPDAGGARAFPEECAEIAAGFLAAAGLMGNQHIGPARLLAQHLNNVRACGREEFRSPPRPRRDKKRVETKLRDPAGFRAAAALRLPDLEPWVEGLRQELFRIDDSPFQDDEAAVKWLQGGELHHRGTVPWAVVGYNTRIAEVVQEYEELTGARPEVPRVLLGAVITPPGRAPLNMLPGTLQAVLVEETRVMSEGSGFSHWQLALHVLTGEEPELHGWRLTYVEPHRSSEVVLDASISAPVAKVIFDGPPKHTDLIELYDELHDAWKSHKESDADRALEERIIQAVAAERGGGVKRSKPFFEEVCRRLIAAGVSLKHGDPAKDWSNAKQRYCDRERAKKSARR
jgi:hypothetical protein